MQILEYAEAAVEKVRQIRESLALNRAMATGSIKFEVPQEAVNPLEANPDLTMDDVEARCKKRIYFS